MTVSSDQIGYDDNHTKRQPGDINPKDRLWEEIKSRDQRRGQEIKKDDNTNLVSCEWTSKKCSSLSLSFCTSTEQEEWAKTFFSFDDDLLALWYVKGKFKKVQRRCHHHHQMIMIFLKPYEFTRCSWERCYCFLLLWSFANKFVWNVNQFVILNYVIKIFQ